VLSFRLEKNDPRIHAKLQEQFVTSTTLDPTALSRSVNPARLAPEVATDTKMALVNRLDQNRKHGCID
jgi:hypothetical protein